MFLPCNLFLDYSKRLTVGIYLKSQYFVTLYSKNETNCLRNSKNINAFYATKQTLTSYIFKCLHWVNRNFVVFYIMTSSVLNLTHAAFIRQFFSYSDHSHKNFKKSNPAQKSETKSLLEEWFWECQVDF